MREKKVDENDKNSNIINTQDPIDTLGISCAFTFTF